MTKIVSRSLVLALSGLGLFSACSSDTTAKPDSGGSTSTAKGGSTTTGGSSQGGSVATGGSVGPGSGGSNNTGGTSTVGGSPVTGASPAMGGVVQNGGAAATGGLPATGGTSTNGGAASSGGVMGSGGSLISTGGTVVTGGTKVDAGGGAVDAPLGGIAGTDGGTGTGGTSGTGGSTVCAPPTVNLSGADAVDGKLIQFNDNGGWCWYQDERAIVDVKGGKLVIGSLASGGSRNGYAEAVIYDIATGAKKLYTLGTGLSNVVDDHNAPGLLVRPDGKYFAMWSGHRSDCYSRTSIFDGTAWSAEKKFDWASLGCPWAGASTNMVTYSNPWYMGSAIYAAVRSIGTDPAVLSSTDDGQTLGFYGRLMSTKQTGYVAGYFKYWGNNTDRIDFVGTEAHPRDFDTSLYHGYIKDGKVYNSMDTVKDASLKDTSSTSSTSVDINTYTPVFKTGSTIGGVKLEHAWNHDLVRYADGTIAILGQARVTGTGTTDPDKRMLYFRFDGTAWKATYLAKAGTKLYADEQDYTGLGALVPDDPRTIYLSTPYDPTTDTMKSGAKREIWRGTTCDNGATFKWTPVTANSTKDNIRPIVPKWDANHTALLWLQGTYSTAQKYAMAVVGTITGP